jgi:hypothetical protein
MAARSATGSTEMARLVRERQDLIADWQAKDKLLIATRSQPPAQRNAASERAFTDQLAAIDVRLAEIDAALAKQFPDYTALANPKPISVADVQTALGDNEALLLFLDTAELKPVAEETYVWAVTKSEARWGRSELGTESLAEIVQAFRCGLDEEEWSTPTRASECAKRLGVTELPDTSQPLPFDLDKAHKLYVSLFGEVEGLIRDKRLLIVASGPLTSLPFQVLVTEPAAEARPRTFEGYSNIAWLARKHAISVLPAVSSLKALRGRASHRVRADQEYVGYGNPILQGDSSICRTIKVPGRCPGPGTVVSDAGERATVRGNGARRSVGIRTLASHRGNVSETIKQVKALCPLPDTAYEIRCIAGGFSAAGSRTRP